MPNLVQQKIVEHVAFEGTTMIAGDPMPLFRDAIVVSCARYFTILFINYTSEWPSRKRSKEYHLNPTCA